MENIDVYTKKAMEQYVKIQIQIKEAVAELIQTPSELMPSQWTYSLPGPKAISEKLNDPQNAKARDTFTQLLRIKNEEPNWKNLKKTQELARDLMAQLRIAPFQEVTRQMRILEDTLEIPPSEELVKYVKDEYSKNRNAIIQNIYKLLEISTP